MNRVLATAEVRAQRSEVNRVDPRSSLGDPADLAEGSAASGRKIVVHVCEV